MVAVPQQVSGKFGGATVALVSNDPVWFVVKVDSNLASEFRLFHRDAGSQQWHVIASGKSSMSIRVDQAVADLRLDTLGWIILCSPLNAGTFPVFVQLFQGNQGTGFTPITRVAQYDVTVGSTNAFQPIDDTVTLK
jgi:hypothetical protein